VPPRSLYLPHIARASQFEVQLPLPQYVGPYPHVPAVLQQLIEAAVSLI
jgi:hypothetical protein